MEKGAWPLFPTFAISKKASTKVRPFVDANFNSYLDSLLHA